MPRPTKSRHGFSLFVVFDSPLLAIHHWEEAGRILFPENFSTQGRRDAKLIQTVDERR